MRRSQDFHRFLRGDAEFLRRLPGVPATPVLRPGIPDHVLWEYGYDALGRRISKRCGPDETLFSWDGTRLSEQAAPGDEITTWDHTPGTHRPLTQTTRVLRAAGESSITAFAEDRAPTFHAIVTDAVGTPTELVTATGELAWQQRTSLWGTSLPAPPADAVDCPLRFPGQYHDPETGLSYNYFRYYDSERACYLTVDPLGLAPAPNPKAYVRNPLTWADPFGLAPYERYRADSRSRETIFNDGFAPKGSNMNLEEHVYGVAGDYTPPSGYVSTTDSANHAFSRLKTTDGHVYLIRESEGGVNVNKEIPGNPMSHEREFAYPRKVERTSIVGAWDKDKNWTPNPNYGGSP
ncbi:RHS repeat-associated core domain-containing protein [Streptomyces sp. NPDC051162]|uniref:RHS repeat-associated core domain-containing protein n=1 Tax=Streptomyces sp. NPDC051162 TaxID=3154747 RepID=UPI003448CF15